MYLIRKRLNGKAHHWDGSDTKCRMASTGGISMRKYMVAESSCQLLVCHLCAEKLRKEQVQ